MLTYPMRSVDLTKDVEQGDSNLFEYTFAKYSIYLPYLSMQIHHLWSLNKNYVPAYLKV